MSKEKSRGKPDFTVEDVVAWVESAEGQAALKDARKKAEKTIEKLEESRKKGMKELRKRWFDRFGAAS